MGLRVGCILFSILAGITTISAQAVAMAHFQLVQLGKGPGYQPTSILPCDPNAAQNVALMQNSVMTLPGNTQRKAQQLKEYKSILAEIKEDEKKAAEEAVEIKASPYKAAYQQLASLQPDSFSLAKAVYLSETAGYKTPASFEAFKKAIRRTADGIRQYMKATGLDAKNNTAINYALMQFFGKPTTFKDPKTGKMMMTRPFRYDFTDYMGDKDVNQQAVAKLLITGAGQCHSMPLLYLLLCEELGGKAYLVKSPEHSFVRFYDSKGTAWNFETTSGQLITNAFYVQSGYMSIEALKNGLYMDTLSRSQLLSSAITDYVNVYQHNIGYDHYSTTANDYALQLDGKNLQALMYRSNLQTFMCRDALRQAGNPKPADLPRYPQLQQALAQRDALYQQMDNLGWQRMPPAMYLAWLKSTAAARHKQEAVEMQTKMQQEISKLKRTQKPTIITQTKPQ